ncbi:MAG: hypothetical protein APF77_20975 [Clostridia bacterium BRH_c25]|nr:MAG: hypothetical protein APF77_20975 [Clostridia bacterium BRH_c25]
MSGEITKITEAVSRNELVKLTKELISIPSYYGIRDQETEVAKHILAIFQKEGIECRLEEVKDGRCNVYAVLKGTGTGKSLMLNGHLDTIPPYDMADACCPHVSGNKLYGRGASDMKGSLAAMVISMITLKRLNIPLKGDVVFAGVIDEERQSLGSISLLEKGIRTDAAIVGEPTESKICTAHRGLEWYEFAFTGKTVHGGRQQEGINAISKALKFMCVVENELAPRLIERRHPILGNATVNIGVIQGGTQLSTVAGYCSVYLDRRFLPYERYKDIGQEFLDIIERLSSQDADFKCEMKVTQDSIMEGNYVHLAYEIDRNDPFVRLMHNKLSRVLGIDAELSYFPAWTDAALLSNYGKIPTVVFGPGYMACCHSKDEFVEVSQLVESCITYALTAVDYCNQEK